MYFEDGMFGAEKLKALSDKGVDTSTLSGALVFACYGSVFSKHLDCPWIAFDKGILREAPKAYLAHLFRIWKDDHPLKKAIDTIWEHLHEDVVAELKHIFKESIQIYDELIEKYESRKEITIAEQVAKVLLYKKTVCYKDEKNLSWFLGEVKKATS